MENLKDFLFHWSKVRNLKGMGEARELTLKNIKNKDDLTKGQKDNKWQELIKDELPDPGDAEWNFSEDEWKKFYSEFHKAFQEMAANPDAIRSNEKAQKFLKEYYTRTGAMFPEPKLVQGTVNSVKDFGALLEGNRESFKLLLAGNVDNFDEVLAGIKDGSYQSNPKLREGVDWVVHVINHFMNQEEELVGHLDEKTIDALKKLNLPAIRKGLKPDTEISDINLERFKKGWEGLLETLYSTKPIREAFPGKNITAQIEDGISKTNWKEGDDKLEQTFPDAPKNVLEKMKDWTDEKYNNSIGRFANRHNRHIYKTGARHVVDAIVKKFKIDPTLGLAGIFDKYDDIHKEVAKKSPSAAAGFKWMKETLAPMREGKMKAAFEEALKDGQKLNALVEQMAIQAVEQGKVKECEAAMEVLAVMRYDSFTSSRYGKFAAVEFTPFEGFIKDPTLKPLAPVFQAAQWSIHTMIKGAAKGVILGRNLWKRKSAKFGEAKSKLISSGYKERDDEKRDEFAQSKKDKDDLIVRAKRKSDRITYGKLRLEQDAMKALKEKSDTQARLAELLKNHPGLENKEEEWQKQQEEIDALKKEKEKLEKEGTLEKQREKIEKEKENLAKFEEKFAAAKTGYKPLEQRILDAVKDSQQEIIALTKEIAEREAAKKPVKRLQNKLEKLFQQSAVAAAGAKSTEEIIFDGSYTLPKQEEAIKKSRARIKKLEKNCRDIEKLDTEILTKEQALAEDKATYEPLVEKFKALNEQISDADAIVAESKNRVDELTQEYDETQDNITGLDEELKQIDKDEAKFEESGSKEKQMQELLDFWNKINGIRASNFNIFRSKKDVQKESDDEAAAIAAAAKAARGDRS